MKTRNSGRQKYKEDQSVTCQEVFTSNSFKLLSFIFTFFLSLLQNVSMSEFALPSTAQTPRKKRGPITKRHNIVRILIYKTTINLKKNKSSKQFICYEEKDLNIPEKYQQMLQKHVFMKQIRNLIMIENLMKSKLKMPLTTYIKTYYNVLRKIEIYFYFIMLKKYLFHCNSKDQFQQKRVQTKSSENTSHFEQYNYMKRTDIKPPPIDMEETRKQEIQKFRSTSLYNKKQIRMPTSECKSNEKIKVFNIFNSTPRNVKPSRSQQMLNGFKEKVVYSSHNRQTSATKPQISSRLTDSQQPTKQNMIPLQKFFKDHQNKLQQNVKYELEKHANNNILELLLLTTGELKKKFEDKANNSRQNSEERARIKVRNSHKFPKDFFL